MRKIVLTTAAIVLFAISAHASDPIVGNWRTEAGETANIAPCGGDSFCVVLKTGTYAGKNIGSLVNDNGNYSGKVTDPATDRTYRGKASIEGTSMKMSGCVLGGLICQSQTWVKN